MPRRRTSAELRRWRRRQGRGAIMKPSTFEHIKRSAAASGLPGSRVAGAAYWNAARAKFRRRRRRR